MHVHLTGLCPESVFLDFIQIFLYNVIKIITLLMLSIVCVTTYFCLFIDCLGFGLWTLVLCFACLYIYIYIYSAFRGTVF